jgi:hypothetical protein
VTAVWGIVAALGAMLAVYYEALSPEAQALLLLGLIGLMSGGGAAILSGSAPDE